MQKAKEKAKVVLLATLAAIGYGIVHDQVTAHLCVEYFTLAHPPLFHTASPLLLGFCWGIAATAGIGLVLGAALAAVSQCGAAPPVSTARLSRSILLLLAIMALSASAAGVLGFELSVHRLSSLPSSWAGIIAPGRRDRFMAVWFAHGASYLAGLAGGAGLIHRVWRERGRPRIFAALPSTPLSILRALALMLLAILIIYLRFFRD